MENGKANRDVFWIIAGVVFLVLVILVALFFPRNSDTEMTVQGDFLGGVDAYEEPSPTGYSSSSRGYIRIQSEKFAYESGEEVPLTVTAGYVNLASEAARVEDLCFEIYCCNNIELAFDFSDMTGLEVDTSDWLYSQMITYNDFYAFSTKDFDPEKLSMNREDTDLSVNKQDLSFNFAVHLKIKEGAPEEFSGSIIISTYATRFVTDQDTGETVLQVCSYVNNREVFLYSKDGKLYLSDNSVAQAKSLAK